MMTLGVGCNKTSIDGDVAAYGDGEGCVEFSIALDDTRSIDSEREAELLEKSILKIYDADDRLIRRYEPATEMPESIYILAGDYTATLILGDQTEASTDELQMTFYGEESFSVVSQTTSTINIDCTILNTIVDVSFDETIANYFTDGYTLRFAAAESYSDEAYNSTTVGLEISQSATGYFIVPEGDNLTWEFSGVANSAVYSKDVTAQGVIESPKSGGRYTLSFKYTTDLEVSSILIELDESTDDVDDSMSFAPQPTITPIDFSMSDIHLPSQDYRFTVSAIQAINSVAITVGDTTIYPFVDGVESSVSGASYTMVDNTNGELTLSSSLFTPFTAAGENDVNIKVTDIKGTYSDDNLSINITGVTPPTNIDLWLNSANFTAYVYEDNAESVAVEYKAAGEDSWRSATLEQVDDYTYNVSIDAEWSSSNNSYSLPIFTQVWGISPATSYEYRLKVGESTYTTESFTTDDDRQTIPDSDVPSGLSCYGENISSSSTTWASGNNSYSSELCTYGSYGGEGCAYLESTSVTVIFITKFAAGNLYYGTFNFASTTGTASFGQDFEWKARPKSLKVRYAATLGTVSSFTYSGYLSSGDTDRGRIFVAIVDWDSRHDVKASTSATGMWDPESQLTTEEGDIIGYGSYFVDESTTGTELEDLEIDIVYYDTTTKPSDNITLVISCAASAYGDYFAGSTSSKMWIKDFEFGY